MSRLVDEALEAIRAVHGDTSVSLEETLDALKEIKDEVDTYIDAVESDIDNRDEG